MDKIICFSIKNTDFVGKFVRLEDSIKNINQDENLPEIVKDLLLYLKIIVSLLGSGLKYNGNVSITVKSNKYIRFATADYFDNGTIRSYVNLKSDDKITDETSLKELIKDGKLLLTMNYPGSKDYQSILNIRNHENLSELMEEYFAKSEQLGTYIKLSKAIKYNNSGKILCAGGIILQNLSHNDKTESDKNRWYKMGLLIANLADDELVDQTETIESILCKLFGQNEIKLYGEKSVKSGCKCSKEKFKNIIQSFGEEEIRTMYKDGKIFINCDFCNQETIFTESDFII